MSGVQDKFFGSLLLDQRILYLDYNVETHHLTLSYDGVRYELSFQRFVDEYPLRKPFTLQSAAIYYLACVIWEQPPSFLRDDILANYRFFRERNLETRTDLLSMVLICVPSFILPVIPGDPRQGPATLFRTISSKKRLDKKLGDTSAEQSTAHILLTAFLVILIVGSTGVLFMMVRGAAAGEGEVSETEEAGLPLEV